MKTLLSLLVALLFAFSTLALAGCDEEGEYWDEDTDSEIEPEPEPNTDFPQESVEESEPPSGPGAGDLGKASTRY